MCPGQQDTVLFPFMQEKYTWKRMLLGTCPCHRSHHGNSLPVKAHGKHPDLFPACTMRQSAQVKLGWDWALENPCLPTQETQEMQVWFLGQEDPLEQGMATHSSILAWKNPRTEEPGGLQSTGHDWAHKHIRKMGVKDETLFFAWCNIFYYGYGMGGTRLV